MLSSKGESKVEERFQARIDMLTERLDSLAQTVATTASAIAKKDGEIAGLRRDLQVRDEQIQALAARAQATAGADPRELQALRQTVDALAKERATQGSTKQFEDLTGKITLLGQRLETVSTTVSTTAAGLAGRDGELAAIRKQLESRPANASAPAPPDPDLKRQVDELTAIVASGKLRLDDQAAELEAVKAQLAEPHAPAEELRAMLTTLRARVESLDGLRTGVSEEQLDERLGETSSELEGLSERIETLAASVESATASLGDKEHELAALHRHFTESSSRIESVVDDLREALGAFPEAGPDALATVRSQVDSTAKRVDAVGQRLEKLEATRAEDLVAELVERLDLLDKRVSSISAEIARAKTLWPVALRSLEARLDDIAARSHDSPAPTDEPAAQDADDLLAGLRDSLQAMESVAAEMERASEPEPEPERAAEAEAPEEPIDSATTQTQPAVAGGARIVPLRSSGDP
jgi:chromosome segregation ATPase